MPSLLLVLCLASLGWALTFGIGTQLISLGLHVQGCSDTVIGINSAAHYLGLALGSLFVPAIMARSPRRCAPLGMLVCAISMAAFPWLPGASAWFVLRLVNGAAGAVSLVPLETFVSTSGGEDKRSRNFALFGLALTVGGAIGIESGLHLFVAGAYWPYLVAAAPSLMGLAGLLLGANDVRGHLQAETRGGIDWLRNVPGFATAWAQGFLEGGMLAFLALYLLTRGFSRDAAAALMGVTMGGVALFQVPLAWLGDRFGRMKALLCCYGLVIVCLFFAPFANSFSWLALCLLVFGACSGAMYPLGLAIMSERTPLESRAQAYSLYLAMECVGSLMGAAISGKARDGWGETALFWVCLAAIGVAIAAWGASIAVAGSTPQTTLPKSEACRTS